MMTKEIILPEGWCVDKIEDGKIILKEPEKEPELNTWEKCCRQLTAVKEDLAFIDEDGNISNLTSLCDEDDIAWYNNVFPKEYAEPMLALMQLLVCYKAWVGNWKPDWEDASTTKYDIYIGYNTPQKTWSISSQHLLAFPTLDMRDKFFETFKDLIEQAKPLL
jgi:hypothetical protein